MQLWTFSLKFATKKSNFIAHWIPKICMWWCMGEIEHGWLAKTHTIQLYSQFLLWVWGHCPTFMIVCSAGPRSAWKRTVNLCPPPPPLDPSLKSYTVAKICLLCSSNLQAGEKNPTKKNGDFYKVELWGDILRTARRKIKEPQRRGSLPRKRWHHSLAPSAKPGYKRCRDLHCRPELLYL